MNCLNPESQQPKHREYVNLYLVACLVPITCIVCATLCELHDKSLCSIALFVLALFTLPTYQSPISRKGKEGGL